MNAKKSPVKRDYLQQAANIVFEWCKQRDTNHDWLINTIAAAIHAEREQAVVSERKRYWIRPEAISKPCVYHAAVYTEQDLELAENKQFILDGIEVVEASQGANSATWPSNAEVNLAADKMAKELCKIDPEFAKAWFVKGARWLKQRLQKDV